MKEYVIELDQDELDAIDMAAWYIGGYGSTSRIVFPMLVILKLYFMNIQKLVMKDICMFFYHQN